MNRKRIKGLDKLRSMHSTKQRSIPRAHQSSEIELFLLEKEKERFLKEAERLQTRLHTVYERIESLNEEINLQKEAGDQKRQEQVLDQDSLQDIKGIINRGLGTGVQADGEQWNTKKLMY